MRKRDPDLTPLPRWRQHRAALVAWWRRSKNQRQRALKDLGKAGRRALTLAISVLGAILVSYGAWSVYAPAGWIVGGGLLWAIQWNYGDEGSDG
jgi:hypothetical protein